MTEKKNVFNTAKNLYEGRGIVINVFKSRLSQLKPKTGRGLKILTPKQLLPKITDSSCTSKSK